ncbi:MAG: hypothetical protein H7Z75_18555 [Ferruginibacter sp.]|nr:hypothetical protein [Cytophagales bacterium]
MPLQNRVTPFSGIEAVPYRGLFMGNRGVLHDERKQLLTQGWRHRAWIICELNYQDRRRALMQPRRYTELFFPDEAVALAAGHRPCAWCRRSAFRDFVSAWSSVTGAPAVASALDAGLHPERVARLRGQVRWTSEVGALPTGTFTVDPGLPGQAWLKWDDRMLLWSRSGYVRAERWPDSQSVEILTPPTSLHALRAGYRPVLHPSGTDLLR